MVGLPEFNAEDFQAHNHAEAAAVVFGTGEFYVVGARQVGTPGPIRMVAIVPNESMATAFAMFLGGEDGAESRRQGFEIVSMKYEAEDA